MLPVLFDFKFIKIYTFGVFLVLAFFWSLFLFWKTVKLTSHKEEEMFDSVFISLILAIFFSRFFFVIINFRNFGFSLLKFILINGFPGMSIYGLIFGGLLGLSIYHGIKKNNIIKLLDYYVASILLASAIIKIGSFFGGIDVGTETKFLLAVRYSGYAGSRHLTPIYESILLFLGTYFTHRILLAVRRTVLPSGFAFYFAFFWFGLVNLLLDNIKQNHLYLGSINFNLIISGAIVLTLGGYFLYFFRIELVNLIKDRLKKITQYGKINFKRTTGFIQEKIIRTRKEPKKKD